MFDDNRKDEEEGAIEVKDMVTTVDDKIDYVMEAFVTHLDALAQKERTNQDARANIEVGGQVIVKDVPATLLLALEGRLAKLRTMYMEIPTLDPGFKWEPDEQSGKGIFRTATPEFRHKTEKTLQTKEIFKPTDKQPGQYEKWNEDRPVGTYKTERKSSMLTPARKSRLLGRLDTLLNEVRKARMRANKAQIVDVHVGKALVDFING